MSDSLVTKKFLALNLKELIKKKPLSKISIGELCEVCGINRKTFYYHFKDKNDLVNWIYYNEFISIMDRIEQRDWDILFNVCEYLYHNQLFYKNTFGLDEQNSFKQYFYEYIYSILEKEVKQMQLSSGYEDFFVSFYADAFAYSIEKWILSNHPMSPEEYVSSLKVILTKGAKEVIKRTEN